MDDHVIGGYDPNQPLSELKQSLVGNLRRNTRGTNAGGDGKGSSGYGQSGNELMNLNKVGFGGMKSSRSSNGVLVPLKKLSLAELKNKKLKWQRIIFLLSFLTNYFINYDLEVCEQFQQKVKATDDLPTLQFVRLTCSITILWFGLLVEQMTDSRSKCTLFVIMTSLIMLKLYQEIQKYSNPIDFKN